MTSDSILRLLLWIVVINAALLVLLMWRRGLRGQAGYVLLLGANLLLAVVLLAANLHDHPLAVVTIGVFFFLAVVPVVLRGITAWAARHGRWRLAMGLTSARELLQPGAGVGRERQLLAFLQELQSGDKGDVVERLKEKSAGESDPELEAVLHEQILTILALERRWEDAEAWAEGRVRPVMVASRPRLGSALIRIYGERGRLDALVRTMYLVEGGPGAEDPDSAEVLAHCRIMTLAFTGHAKELETLLGNQREGPLAAKIRAFWLGIAWQQAGDASAAREWFDRAAALLDSEDVRAREALTARRAQLLSGGTAQPLPDPEQTRRLVAAILERSSARTDRPSLRPQSPWHTPVTLLVVLVNILVFALVEWFGKGADANQRLILAGASLSGAVSAGEVWRLASAMFLHAGLFHLILNSFMLWFLGRFAEQLLGSIRFFVVYFGAGLAGNVASHLWREYPVSVGASGSIFGMLGATLASMLLSRGHLPERWRRSMVLVLVLVIGLSFLPGLDVKQIDNFAHLGGLVGGIALATLLLLSARHSAGQWLASGLGLIFVGVIVYSAWGMATSNLDRLSWHHTTQAGMRISHPVSWFTTPGSGPSQVMILHLFDEDTIRLTRGAGRLEPPASWQANQLRELEGHLAKPSPHKGRQKASALPEKSLPAPWRAVEITDTGADGRTRLLVVAYGYPSSEDALKVPWLAEMVTEPSRRNRLLQMLAKMLTELRSRPSAPLSDERP